MNCNNEKNKKSGKIKSEVKFLFFVKIKTAA